MRALIDQLFTMHRLDDGYQYLKVTRRPDARLLARLLKHPEHVHVFDSDPPVTDLEWLQGVRDRVRRLIVLDFSVKSIDMVNSLERLESLSLWTSPDAVGEVMCGRLGRLRELAIGGYVKFNLAGSLVRDLSIEKAQAETILQVERLAALQSLELSSPKRVPVTFASPGLESLELSFTKMSDEDELHGISRLKRLSLVNIRGLTSLTPFSEAATLEELYIEDCPELTSLRGPTLQIGAQPLIVGRTPLRRSRGRR